MSIRQMKWLVVSIVAFAIGFGLMGTDNEGVAVIALVSAAAGAFFLGRAFTRS